MNTILLWIVILLNLIVYIIFLDIILSWLTLFWLRLRPKILADIINPLYINVKKYIPTTIWPLDFTPIVILIIISFIRWLIYINYPEILAQLPNFLK